MAPHFIKMGGLTIPCNRSFLPQFCIYKIQRYCTHHGVHRRPPMEIFQSESVSDITPRDIKQSLLDMVTAKKNPSMADSLMVIHNQHFLV
jgi:hypothetical protein